MIAFPPITLPGRSCSPPCVRSSHMGARSNAARLWPTRRWPSPSRTVTTPSSCGCSTTCLLPYSVPSLHEQSLVRTADSLVRAERVGDPVLLFFAVFWRADVASQAGDIDEIGSLPRHHRLACRATRTADVELELHRYRAARALIAGDTDRAEELATDALKIGTDCGQPDASLFFGTHLIGVNQRRGTLGELTSRLGADGSRRSRCGRGANCGTGPGPRRAGSHRRRPTPLGGSRDRRLRASHGQRLAHGGG